MTDLRLSVPAICLLIATVQAQMMMRQTSQNNRFMPRMAPIMRQPAMMPPFKPIRRALGYNTEEAGNSVGTDGFSGSISLSSSSSNTAAGNKPSAGVISGGSASASDAISGTSAGESAARAVPSESSGATEGFSGTGLDTSSSSGSALDTTLAGTDTGSTVAPLGDTSGVEGSTGSATNAETTTRVAPTVPEFNSALLGGQAGSPGLKLRLNPPFWVHADHHVSPILNDKIKNAQIPNIHQCLPQVNGCLYVSDVKVTSFRCAERVNIRPRGPNQLVIAVRNLDVGASANLAGRVSLYIAVPLTGNIQLNLRGVSLTAAISVIVGADGTPKLQVASCKGHIRDADIHIQNGGTIGTLANGQFQPQFAKALRKLLPKQLCKRLPGLLQEQVGGIAEILPKSVPLSEIFNTVLDAMGLKGNSAESCPATCPTAGGSTTIDVGLSDATTAVPFKARAFRISKRHHLSPTKALAAVTSVIRRLKKSLLEAYAGGEKPSGSASSSSGANSPAVPSASSSSLASASSGASGSVSSSDAGSVGESSGVDSSASVASVGSSTLPTGSVSDSSAGEVTTAVPGADGGTPSSDSALDAGSSTTVDPACASCSGNSLVGALVDSLDMEKAKRILLSIKILQAAATNDIFAVAVNGEFSPDGRGGTPFTAFPMDFPTPNGNDRMAEVLLSDFTINSALYHLHKVGFLNVKLTPETPTIGAILKTSCGFSDEFDDTGVELDEATTAAPAEVRRAVARRIVKRQNLEELGICLGTVMPALAEKYPHKKVVINAHTISAPSVQFRSDNGGTVHIEALADADMSIQDSGEDIGTLRIDVAADIKVVTNGSTVSGVANFTRLNLTDPTGKTGLPQDALDSIVSLAKDTLQSRFNEMLGKGKDLEKMDINLGGIPLTLEHGKVDVLNHAVHVSADVNIADENFAALGFNVDTEEVCSTPPGSSSSLKKRS